jgi:type II secretory pathway component PulK
MKVLSKPRRAAVLALVLACLFLMILLSAQLAASALQKHRRLQQRALEQQAAWVAESALARSAAQLRRDPDYAGETWTIPAADLDGRHEAEAVISVSTVETSADARRIQVEAHYPNDPVRRMTAVRAATVRVPPAPEESP